MNFNRTQCLNQTASSPSKGDILQPSGACNYFVAIATGTHHSVLDRMMMVAIATGGHHSVPSHTMIHSMRLLSRPQEGP